MENESKEYFCFALPMLRLLYTHQQTAVDYMLAYGAYRASLCVKADRFAGYRQLLYMCKTKIHRHQVPFDLWQLVVDWTQGDDPADVVTGEYMESDGTGNITDELISDFVNKYGDAKDDEVMEWYRLYLVQKVLGVIIHNIPKFLENGRKLHNKYGTGQVPVSCSKSLLFRFQESIKTEYDRVRCAMYFAIRSLCGNGVAVTTSTAILWRMMGCRNHQELSVVLRDKKLKSVWVKYATKRQYRTIINDLITSKLIMETRYGNRTCITASIMDESEFVEAVANKIRKINTTRMNKTAAAQRQRLSGMLKERINSS